MLVFQVGVQSGVGSVPLPATAIGAEKLFGDLDVFSAVYAGS